jgi:hypothetical protein
MLMATTARALSGLELPAVTGTVYYCSDIPGRALQDLVDPKNTYRPVYSAAVKIKDARPIRKSLSLDKQGFVLLDHVSSVSQLRDKKAMEATYNSELQELIKGIAKADLVLPYLQLFVRFSKNSTVKTKDETERPSADVHLDFTSKSFWDNVGWVQDAAGLTRKKYRRVALYQTWRAVSEPPQDFPLCLTDSMSVIPGNTVIMDNIIGPRDVVGNVVETRLAKQGPHDSWYYFSNMRANELILFMGFDSDRENDVNVLHTSFENKDTLGTVARESIEARFFVFWE